MAMTEDDLGPEARRRIDEAHARWDRARAARDALRRKQSVGAEEAEAATTRVVFTITIDQSVIGMRVEGPATGLDALAALNIFFEMIKTAHDVSPTMPVAWLPGLEAAREELRAMASIMRIDLTPFRSDGDR